MNTTQAKKNINIVEYLQSNGYQHVKQNRVWFWYLSPFRNEKTASFAVNAEKNTFTDWGTGERGTIIDLVMHLRNTNISGALKILSEHVPDSKSLPVFSFNKQFDYVPQKTMPGRIENIRNWWLKMYLTSRRIDENAWRNCEFLYQYTYRNPKSKSTGQPFRNLAWKNDKGGYELRSGHFKSCLLYKEITTIPGTSEQLNIFEGFFDYLSALTFYKVEKLKGTTIVLNSVVLLDRIVSGLSNYETVNAYLDNDKAGETAFRVINEAGKHVKNMAKDIYPDFKDFNEFLTGTYHKPKRVIPNRK